MPDSIPSSITDTETLTLSLFIIATSWFLIYSSLLLWLISHAIFAFLISESYEDTIRNVVSFGGDADTMGAIAGAIAGAYFGVPDKIKSKLKEYLTTDLEEIVNQFDKYIKI